MLKRLGLAALLSLPSAVSGSENIPSLVSVRVFAKYKLSAIKCSTVANKFTVNGEAVDGPLAIKIKEGKLEMRAHGRLSRADSFSITPEEERFVVGLPPRAIKRTFGGELIVEKKRGELIVVNKVPLEAYVAGVTAAECPDMRQAEALAAQTIVVRSYALAERGQHKRDGYDFCDLTHCQVYKGLGKLPAHIAPIAESTKGSILTYEDKVILSYYHSCCGGRTQRSQDLWGNNPIPYIVEVSDWDPETKTYYCQKAANFRWSSRLSLTELTRAARKAGWINGDETVVQVTVPSRGLTGRAMRVNLKTNRRHKVVTGSDFYHGVGRALGWRKLRSTWFTYTGPASGSETFHFEGRGYGHGVGFCQLGAEGLAKAGKSRFEILRHYFPKCQLVN